jgi:ABC-type proline/glycine betaine transport system permease subunit
MSTSQPRRWRAEEKLRILEEARQADQTVSAACRHYQIAPMDASCTAALGVPMRIWLLRKKVTEAVARLTSGYLVVQIFKCAIYTGMPGEVETKKEVETLVF